MYMFGMLHLNASGCHPNPGADKSSFHVKSAVRPAAGPRPFDQSPVLAAINGFIRTAYR